MLVLSAVGLWAGFRKQSIECQLYFWILKSYQHGTRIGREGVSRATHITAWTKSAAEKFWMRLHSSACVRLRLCAFVYVRVHLHMCVCAQTRLDAKNLLCPDAFLFKDFRDVLYHTNHKH